MYFQDCIINNQITLYSPYGYIEVDKTLYLNPEKEMIHFTKKAYKLSGTLRKYQLTDHIGVFYKTFHGDRITFPLNVSIYEKLNEAIPKICIEEDKLALAKPELKKLNYADQFRLISSNGLIRELNPLKAYHEEGIKHDEIIIMLNHKSINFSEVNKGVLVGLHAKNKIAYKQGGDEHQFAMAEQGYNSGKHYCEVILQTEPYERSVIIGLSTKRTEFHLNSSEMKGFYGFILSECKKVSNNTTGKVELIDYGEITKIGDRIGIMMEFGTSGLDVSFYINKINMGVAFKGLLTNTYYPSVVLGFDGTMVRITNNVVFPDL